jgi:hypothetical protein
VAMGEVPAEGAIISTRDHDRPVGHRCCPVDRELTIVVNSPAIAAILGTRPTSMCSCSAAGCGVRPWPQWTIGRCGRWPTCTSTSLSRHQRLHGRARPHHARPGRRRRSKRAMIGADAPDCLADHTKIGQRLSGAVRLALRPGPAHHRPRSQRRTRARGEAEGVRVVRA